MTPARKPKGRTLAEFEPLQPAEKKLRSACWQGEVAHIADSCPEAAHENNTVRAGFLRFLALGGDGQAPVHERGVWLQGAWITGTLDLISASVPSDLSMVHCQFSETPLFTGTNIAGSLVFTGSRLPGFAGQGMTISGNLICNFATFDGKEGDALAADGAVIKGGVFLKRARATGTVHLLGVQIGGNLECHDATFDGKKGFALAADRAVINGTVFLTKARATGTVRLLGVQIGGNLECHDATFDGKEGFALAADGAVIKGIVFLTKARATGEVRLLGAQIWGNLQCHDATFDGKKGFALAADGAVINGTVFLTKARATGTVRLLDAQIGGSLTCNGATFDGKKGFALAADGAVIKGIVFLTKARATGIVRLLGVQIEGHLACNDATFDGKDGNALSADGAVIKGIVLLKRARATGTVRLLGVQIGGNLECNDATFDGKDGNALTANSAVIKGTVFLTKARATGTVRLLGVQIGGNLECNDATFDGKEGVALAADGMTVTDSFIFKNKLSFGRIVLAGVHIGRLTDDINSWGSQITLDGLTYGSIAGGAPTDAATRLAWLDKQSPEHAGLNGQGADFKPQPWRQLAKVLREMGHAEDARQVSIAFEKRLREAGRIGLAPASWGALRTGIYQETCRAGHCLFGWLTGYGYRPLRLLAWMVGVWLACALFFWYTALEGVFGPSSPLVFQHPAYADCQPPGGNWYICGKLPEEYSGFSPLAYSLDVILPFVDLQQANSWAPLIPTPEAAWYREILAIDWKHFTRLLMWFETLFGWVSSLLMVAVVSGLAKRREE